MREYQRTCLEEKMCNILKSLNFEFTEQYPVRSGFVIDFAIIVDRSANKKIAIETDGANWHTKAIQKKRDRFRDYKLRKEGWTVIRFGETFTREEVEEAVNTILCDWNTNPV